MNRKRAENFENASPLKRKDIAMWEKDVNIDEVKEILTKTKVFLGVVVVKVSLFQEKAHIKLQALGIMLKKH